MSDKYYQSLAFKQKNIIQNRLLATIEQKNEKEIDQILDLMLKDKIFDRDELTPFMQSMIKNNISERLIEKLKQVYWKNVILCDNVMG